MVRAALIAAHGWDDDAVVLKPIVATGDKILDRPLADVGGKALWTKELDIWLGEGETDASVHSMKDVETIRPPEFVVAAMLERADVRDRLIGAMSIEAIPHGAKFGTSAPRRRAQMMRLRPDLEIVLFRGNVQTRLAKIADGDAAATLLAAAGLARLRMDDGVAIPVETLLPAPSQGAVGIEVRSDDAAAQAIVTAIDHAATSRCVRAERQLLAALSGDCRSPVAAMAVEDGAEIVLRAALYSPDGADSVSGERRFSRGDADAPEELATTLLAGAPASIRAVFGA